MLHQWQSYVKQLNTSYRTYEWWNTYEWVMSHIHRVMSRMWMNCVSHADESCLTNNTAMSHKWMSHVPQMNESFRALEWWHTYERVMSHIHGESCHTFIFEDMAQSSPSISPVVHAATSPALQVRVAVCYSVIYCIALCCMFYILHCSVLHVHIYVYTYIYIYVYIYVYTCIYMHQ